MDCATRGARTRATFACFLQPPVVGVPAFGVCLQECRPLVPLPDSLFAKVVPRRIHPFAPSTFEARHRFLGQLVLMLLLRVHVDAERRYSQRPAHASRLWKWVGRFVSSIILCSPHTTYVLVVGARPFALGIIKTLRVLSLVNPLPLAGCTGRLSRFA